MVRFYRQYITPESVERAKLVVYLVAQGSSPDAQPAEETTQENSPAKPSNGQERVIIDNVRDYKAGLVASAGARPTKELGEFEDSDSKL